MINRKEKGNRRENDVVAVFEVEGWNCITARGPGNAWDVLAMGDNLPIVLVQVSSNEWKGRAEVRVLEEWKRPGGTVLIQWRIDDGVNQHDPAAHKLRICPAYCRGIWLPFKSTAPVLSDILAIGTRGGAGVMAEVRKLTDRILRDGFVRGLPDPATIAAILDSAFERLERENARLLEDTGALNVTRETLEDKVESLERGNAELVGLLEEEVCHRGAAERKAERLEREREDLAMICRRLRVKYHDDELLAKAAHLFRASPTREQEGGGGE